MLDSFAFGGDHPGKLVFQSLLIVEALSDLARIDDPLSAKSEEAQKILAMLSESGLKEIDASLCHLINGIALFKSNIKQAQKALLKVRRFPRCVCVCLSLCDCLCMCVSLSLSLCFSLSLSLFISLSFL